MGEPSDLVRRILAASSLQSLQAAQTGHADARARHFLRPEGEDDDGYDPYSDRPPEPEKTWQADPWR